MIKETISESKTYLYRIQRYIWLSLFIFILSVLIGYSFAEHFPTETAQYMEDAKTFFSSIEQETQWQLFLSIFGNNVHAMLTIVALGIFAGIFSIIFLFFNGFLIGMIAFVFTSAAPWQVFALGILPHGIIEIPCMLLSAAIGFRIGKTSLKKLAFKKENVTQELAQGIKFSVTVIVPLLLTAALIETYITPIFISLSRLAFGT